VLGAPILFRGWEREESWRELYVSRADVARVDLSALFALLGQTSIQMTMRYAHLAEEHKREAVAKI
jgi:hypothetical protein